MSIRWIKFCALLTLGFFASSPATARTTAVYQIDQNPGSFLQTRLTQDIYRYSADPQLRDLVVLDSQGNRLPFRIVSITPTEASAREELKTKTPLPFFPVAVGAAPETWLAGKTHIRIDQHAISIDIDQNASKATADTEPAIDFYLLDLNDFDGRIDSLALEWQATQPNRYLDVEVSGTRDLKNWTRLALDTLVHLQKDGQTLTRNEILLNLPRKQYNYLRVKLLRGAEDLALSGIFAQTKTQKIDEVANEIWSVEGEPAQDVNSALDTNIPGKRQSVAAWEYQREERAPVQKMQLDLGDITYGDDLAIFSRATPKQPWRLVYSGIWFNARVGSDWQRSEAITFAANSDPWWRVELDQAIPENTEPQIVFQHPPQKLQFIANNAPPYRIAIDHNPETGNAPKKIFAQLTVHTKPEWLDVSFHRLDPDISGFEITETINWRTGLFWGILLLAVAVLIGFAIRLYRQMN